MEIKKSDKASLENKRLLFVEIGFVVALAVVLFAFEWSSKEKSASVLDAGNQEIIEEEIIPITQETPPPPPEQVKIPVLSDNIDIIDDDIKVDDNIINLEDASDLGVEIQDYKEEVVEEVVEEEAIPFQLVEEKPTFQGGDAATFAKWMSVRLKYPEEAKNAGIQGRVMVKFAVCEDGVVRDAKILRGVNPALDAEALRVISTSPKWEPGTQEGKPVKVTYQFPVIFVRQGEEVTVSDAHGVSQEDGQEVHSYLSVSHKKKQFLFVRSSDVPATSGSPAQRRTDYQQLTD